MLANAGRHDVLVADAENVVIRAGLSEQQSLLDTMGGY